MKASLSYKLLVYLAMITGITMLTVSFLAFSATRVALQRAVGEAQERLARETMEDVDRYLYERLGGIGVVAESIQFDELLSGNVGVAGEVVRTANRFLESATVWESLRLVDASGEPLLFSEGIPLSDEERAAWESAAAGNAYASDAIAVGSDGSSRMLLATPILDESSPGRPVLGVLIGTLSLDEIETIVAGAGTHAVLYDRNGRALAYAPGIDGPRTPAAIPTAEFETDVTTVLAEEQSTLGVRSLANAVAEPGFRGYDGHGWTLLLETPTRIAFAPAMQAALQMAVLILLLGIASGTVVIAVMFPLVIHPLRSLAGAARAMKEGDLSQRAPVASTDEIGYLAMAFNEMADRLQRNYALLEGRLGDVADAKARIEEDKARDEAMLASIGEGIIATDHRGEVTMANAAAEAMLGYAGKELVGTSFDDVGLVDEKGNAVPRSERPIFRALKTGRRVTVTPTDALWSYVRKDAQPVPISITAAPIVLRGKTVGSIEVFRDIRKEVEQERMLQDFISIASHQLRSPLTGIYWILERVLKDESLSSQGRRNLNDVYLLTRNLNELVSLMLNASRIDAGKIPLAVEEIDVVQAAKGHLAGYQPLCERKKIRCRLDRRPGALKVRTVSSLFSLIMQALLSNAIDYTTAGGEVRVRIEKARGRFVLTVRDTGIGIPERDHARVFQKFFRGGNAVLMKPGGTGLGLYSVRRAAELLGGDVRFESKEGEGAAFFVSLPLSTRISRGR